MQNSLVILFDFDGVLLESIGIQLLANELQQDPKYRWNFPNQTPIDSREIIQRFELSSRLSHWSSLRAMNASFSDILPSFFRRWQFFVHIGKRMQNYEEQHNGLIDGVTESLKLLHESGIVMGIVTNSNEERVNYWLKRTKIGHYFSVLISQDDKKRYELKPSPLPILGALEQLKIQGLIDSIQLTRVCFIGDNSSDLQAAHNAGVISIGVLSGHSTQNILNMENPHFLLNSISELPENLNRIFPD